MAFGTVASAWRAELEAREAALELEAARARTAARIARLLGDRVAVGTWSVEPANNAVEPGSPVAASWFGGLASVCGLRDAARAIELRREL